mmetsp:Transcript_31936/g.81022  ORF Transcript_31936/g.81022 Transcript_31936/m.81022 type:complete len:106 (+) Transcript_31936:1367-1684(+)
MLPSTESGAKTNQQATHPKQQSPPPPAATAAAPEKRKVQSHNARRQRLVVQPPRVPLAGPAAWKQRARTMLLSICSPWRENQSMCGALALDVSGHSALHAAANTR